MPAIADYVRPNGDEGPVLVTIEYQVTYRSDAAVLPRDTRVRPRSARGWSIPLGAYRDVEKPNR
jgi:hypothetical protein